VAYEIEAPAAAATAAGRERQQGDETNKHERHEDVADIDKTLRPTITRKKP
jgi:hypothetical protein